MVFMHECAVTEIDGNNIGAHTSIARIPFAEDYLHFRWWCLVRWSEECQNIQQNVSFAIQTYAGSTCMDNTHWICVYVFVWAHNVCRWKINETKTELCINEMKT